MEKTLQKLISKYFKNHFEKNFVVSIDIEKTNLGRFGVILEVDLSKINLKLKSEPNWIVVGDTMRYKYFTDISTDHETALSYDALCSCHLATYNALDIIPKELLGGRSIMILGYKSKIMI